MAAGSLVPIAVWILILVPGARFYPGHHLYVLPCWVLDADLSYQIVTTVGLVDDLASCWLAFPEILGQFLIFNLFHSKTPCGDVV